MNASPYKLNQNSSSSAVYEALDDHLRWIHAVGRVIRSEEYMTAKDDIRGR